MVKRRNMTNCLSEQAALQNKREKMLMREREEVYDFTLDPGYISQDDMFNKADITEVERKKAAATYYGLRAKMETEKVCRPPKEIYLASRRLRWISTKLRKKEELERRQEREKRYQFLGYVFKPDEGILVDHYLRKKCLGENLENCPIEDVRDVYTCHPRGLTEKYLHNGEKVWYFFTHTQLKDNGTSNQGDGWISYGEKNDVIHEGKKVGGKQALVYCEGGHKTKYMMIVYNFETNTPQWYELYACKLYVDGNCEDVQSQPEHSNVTAFVVPWCFCVNRF